MKCLGLQRDLVSLRMENRFVTAETEGEGHLFFKFDGPQNQSHRKRGRSPIFQIERQVRKRARATGDRDLGFQIEGSAPELKL